MPGGEFLDDFPVVRIAVLGLVHHYVIKLALPVILDIREVLQQVNGEVFQVVEVQCVVLHLAAGIGGHARSRSRSIAGGRGGVIALCRTCRIRRGTSRIEGNRRAGPRQHIGVNVVVEVLERTDFRQEGLDCLFRALDSELVHAGLGHRLGILLVQDAEIFREPKPVDIPAQHFHAESVNGAYEIIVVPAVHE